MTRADLPGWLRDPAAECSLCGSPDWTAEWRGVSVVRVCRGCAVEKLPLLVADSLHRPGMPASDAAGAVERVSAGIWRGLALAALRAGRRVA